MRILAAAVIALLVAWIGAFALSVYLVSKDTVTARAVAASCSGVPDATLALPGEDNGGGTLYTCSDRPPSYCGTRGGAGDRPPGQQVLAFLPHDAVWSLEAVKSPCFAADVVLVESLRVTDVAAGPFAVSADEETAPLARLAGSRAWRGVELRPVIRIMPGAWEAWAGGAEADPARLAQEIAGAIPPSARGLCLWFAGEVPDGARQYVAPLLGALHDWAKGVGRSTCVVVPLGSDLAASVDLGALADTIILQGFQPLKRADAAAAPVGLAWFREQLAAAVQRFGAGKLALALGTFSEDQTAGQPQPERIPFAVALDRVARRGGTMGFDAGDLLATANYSDAAGRQHRITLLDAVSAYDEVQIARSLGLGRFVVWPLGYEDPSVWSVLRMPPDLPVAEAAAALAEVNLQDDVNYEGTGAFLRVVSPARDGYRTVAPVPGGDLLGQSGYPVLARPYSIQRYGTNFAPVVALTFDDGPDPEFTPKVLDILAEKHVPATFFQVGAMVVNHPDISRRILDDGHEIGSHTFFHPRLETVSELRTAIELNAFQRVLASVTGHRTLLFRSPYGRTQGPMTGEDARPLAVLDRSGYVIVGADIDTRDWAGLGPDQIVETVRGELAEGTANVLVMHDAGGDRSTTVAALAKLIDGLRADGYRFVSLADLLGVDKSVLMPAETGLRVRFDGVTFAAMEVLGKGFVWIFWIAVILGATRAVIILSLALVRGRRTGTPGGYRPSVTVLIPAYNECEMIVECVSAALASDYDDLKVIVVDDGSDDGTRETVQRAFGPDPRVTLMTEPNQGKWMALDNAYDIVGSEVVVGIDADVLIAPDAIARLVPYFQDPAVGAVAGNVKVRTKRGLLTRLQALEYIAAQNVDRRAAELFNGIMVVPGAIGAWRAQAVRNAGFYSSETLTEDADLTVSVLRQGYRVLFEERAVSYTEVPKTVRSFLRQRLRWIFGMIQTAWKHRGAMREGRPVGLISIPDLFGFGVFLVLLSPIADLVLLATLADLGISALSGTWGGLPPDSLRILLGYLALPALDLVKVLVAFGWERGPRWPLLLVFPFLRLFYQPLLYLTVYRSVSRALTGKLADWGRRPRTAAATKP